MLYFLNICIKLAICIDPCHINQKLPMMSQHLKLSGTLSSMADFFSKLCLLQRFIALVGLSNVGLVPSISTLDFLLSSGVSMLTRGCACESYISAPTACQYAERATPCVSMTASKAEKCSQRHIP